MNLLLKGVERAREHYTYEGVMRQIEAFLRDPLGPNGGDPPRSYLTYDPPFLYVIYALPLFVLRYLFTLPSLTPSRL